MRIETVLRRFVVHPKRRVLVTTVTSVILLAFGWSAVDEYSAVNDRREKLESNLAKTLAAAANLEEFKTKLNKLRESSANLEKRVMTAERVDQFRGELAQLVRDSGCIMRRTTP